MLPKPFFITEKNIPFVTSLILWHTCRKNSETLVCNNLGGIIIKSNIARRVDEIFCMKTPGAPFTNMV